MTSSEMNSKPGFGKMWMMIPTYVSVGGVTSGLPWKVDGR